MKSFSKYLNEMAPPLNYHRKMEYYHGTSTKVALNGIMEHGIRPADLSFIDEYNLRPIPDRIYFTRHLKYAVIYCLGGNYIGHECPKNLAKKDLYGYMCIIDGKTMGEDIQPDEDSVGEFIYNRKITWLNDLAEDHLSNEEYEEDIEDGEIYYEPLLKAVHNGEYAAWAKAGKLIMPYLSDNQKIELIDKGAHISHLGAIYPTQIWKFDKTLSDKLTPNCANFFHLAERIK